MNTRGDEEQHLPSAPPDERGALTFALDQEPNFANYEHVIKLLENGANPNIPDAQTGELPINKVLKFKSNQVAKFYNLFLNYGADVNLFVQKNEITLGDVETFKDLDGNEYVDRFNPLHHAIVAKRKDLLQEILFGGRPNSGNVSINPLSDPNKPGNETCHHLAVNTRDTEILELILKADSRMDHLDSLRETILFTAVRNNDLVMAKFILDLDKESELINHQNELGFTVLMIAIQNKNKQMVELLLLNKADPNLVNSAVETALFLAVKVNSIDLVRLLLSTSGVNPNKDKAFGLKSPLLLAIELGHDEIITELLARKDIKISKNILLAIINKEDTDLLKKVIQKKKIKKNDLMLALLNAIKRQNGELVKIILQSKKLKLENYSDLTISNKVKEKDTLVALDQNNPLENTIPEDNLPLHFAVTLNSFDITRELIDARANVNEKDNLGNTPLHLAVIYGYTNLVTLLLKNHASPNIDNNEGETPLHCACKRGFSKIIEVLLINGDDPNKSNEQTGYTSLQILIKNYYLEVPMKHRKHCDYAESLKILLSHNANPLMVNIRTGETLIQVAMEVRFKDYTPLLEAMANNRNIKSKDNTNIHLALLLNEVKLAEMLIREDKEFSYTNVANSENSSALSCILAYGQWDLLELVINEHLEKNITCVKHIFIMDSFDQYLNYKFQELSQIIDSNLKDFQKYNEQFLKYIDWLINILPTDLQPVFSEYFKDWKKTNLSDVILKCSLKFAKHFFLDKQSQVPSKQEMQSPYNLFAHKKQNKPQYFTKKGNTLLHDAAKKATTLKELVTAIDNIVETHGEKALRKMARTVNNEGQLPFECLRNNVNEHGKMKNKLINLSLEHKYKSITTKLTQGKFNKMIDLYNIKTDSPLYCNLKIAFELINIVRNFMTESPCHPDFNNYTSFRQLEVQDHLKAIRNLDNRDLRIKTAIEFRIGAGEYTSIIQAIAKKLYPNLNTTYITLKRGECVFLVIGEGEHKVICDPLGGRFCPYSEMAKHIKGRRELSVDAILKNIGVFFNSKYHQLVVNEGENKYAVKADWLGYH